MSHSNFNDRVGKEVLLIKSLDCIKKLFTFVTFFDITTVLVNKSTDAIDKLVIDTPTDLLILLSNSEIFIRF